MTVELHCTVCSAPIASERVDARRQIATCGACGSLVDLAPQLGAADGAATSVEPTGGAGAPAVGAPRARQRPPVPLPRGMAIQRSAEGVVLTRRWLRAQHLVLLALLASLTAGLAWAWVARGFEAWMAVAALFAAAWNFLLAGSLVNATTIRVTADEIDVRHGPVPTPLSAATRLRVADVQQLFAAPFGGLFEVGARSRRCR